MKKPLLLASLVTSLMLAAAPAGADALPPDACQTVGAACNNAGPAYDQPGTCTAKTCTKPNPADGGTFEYACNQCVAGSSSGGGGSSSTGGSPGTGAATGTGGSAKSDDSDDGGCALRAPRQSAGVLAGLALLALGAFALRRKSG